ncbi:MAG: hypothetical protein ACI8RZ_006979, partial [Myxococcota bacterium]
GTWGYMAPEQAAGTEVGPPADLFGLACVLYEMAALQPLFPEKKPDLIRDLLARDEGARRASRLSGPHSDLGGILVRALQRDPQARYPSAAAMGRALSSLARDPIIAREKLTRFQEASVALGTPGRRGPGAISASTLDASQPSASQPSASGLPLRVGDVHRPEPIAPAPEYRASAPSGVVRQVQAILAALFIGAALGIVGFTAWRVIAGKPAATPPVEAPVEFPPETPTETPTETAPDVPPAEVVPEPPAEATGTEIAAETPPAAEVVPEAEPPPPAEPVELPVEEPVDEPGVEVVPEVEPLPPEPVAARGLLTIGSIPRAQVLIDGGFVRYTPLFKYQISAGSHTVTLISETGERTSFTVGVLADDEVRRIWSFEDNDWVED